MASMLFTIASPAVQLNRRQKKVAFKQPEESASGTAAKRLSKSVAKKAMKNLVEKNRTLTKVEGRLCQYTRHGILGFGKESVDACWFELDTVSKLFKCWLSGDKKGLPDKKLSLDKLAEIDVNRPHRFMFLHFRDQSRWMHLQAETDEDFERWMSVLKHYRHKPGNQ